MIPRITKFLAGPIQVDPHPTATVPFQRLVHPGGLKAVPRLGPGMAWLRSPGSPRVTKRRRVAHRVGKCRESLTNGSLLCLVGWTSRAWWVQVFPKSKVNWSDLQWSRYEKVTAWPGEIIPSLKWGFIPSHHPSSINPSHNLHPSPRWA